MKRTKRGCRSVWRLATSFLNSSHCKVETCPSSGCNFLIATSSSQYFPWHTEPKPPDPMTRPKCKSLGLRKPPGCGDCCASGVGSETCGGPACCTFGGAAVH